MSQMPQTTNQQAQELRKTRFCGRIGHRIQQAGLICLWAALMTGCATKPFSPSVTGPFHSASNFYLANRKLPEDVRRVAVLPLTSSINDRTARAGRESLQAVLYGELVKSRLFEVFVVTDELLLEWTGKRSWHQDDELPADFLVRLKERTACDAILFNELTHFHSYPPLAIGWRMLLVKTDGQVVWSFDEVFDAGEPRVINSARRHALENEKLKAEFIQESGTRYGALWQSKIAGFDWINSPRQFGKYAAAAAIETLYR